MTAYNDIAQLKAFDAERRSVEEMVALLATGRQLRGTYADTGLVTPEWLDEVIGKIEQAIADRRRDELLRESKMLDMEERKLLTKAERRDEVRARRAEIDKLLGRQSVSTVPTAVPAAGGRPIAGGNNDEE